MIGSVAIAGTTAVIPAVSRFARRETPQSMRGPEAPRANSDNRRLLLGRQRADRQGHRKNLVRPERGITPDARRIDDVEAVMAVRVPESLKTLLCFGREFFVRLAWFRE